MKYGIIGGTYINNIPEPYTEDSVSTPYGDIIVMHKILETGDEVYYMSRHGVLYAHEATRINYRANVYGMYKLGVEQIISLSSVGACDYCYKLGSYCLLSDFIDFTKNRSVAFERIHRKDLHTPMEDVFDPELTDALERIILGRDLGYSGRAVYACMEGPRFETAAEIRMLRMIGAQVVGQTIIPEAPLARSIGMKYASIGIISNYCTGMTHEVRDEDIRGIVQQCKAEALEICFDYIRSQSNQ